MAPGTDVGVYLTPPQLAAKLRVKPETIVAAIRRGELRAMDLARPGSRRPRFRISPEAIREWETQREAAAVSTPRAAVRRRQSKRPAGWVSYFGM